MSKETKQEVKGTEMKLDKEDEERAKEVQEQKQIADDYKIWKKNCPFLYDIMLTHALEWPSLTVQWLPDKVVTPGKDYSVQRLLLGTHTADNEQNFLLIAEVRLPLEDTEIDARSYANPTDEKADQGGYGGAAGKVELIQWINHQGEVNRARYMWQNPNVIATRGAGQEVFVFDKSKHPSKPNKSGEFRPDVRLVGHQKEGYGLSWNPCREGYLLTGADDRVVNVWDINAGQRNAPATIKPLSSYAGHQDVVEDVCWHFHNDWFFASCGDDKVVLLWDTRTKDGKPTHRLDAHKAEVNCVAFSPHSDTLLLSGSSDRSVALWDTRKLTGRVHSFEGHLDQVFNVQWSPQSEHVMASCGADRRVHIWDLSRIGQEQEPEDAEDGPPELLFIHGGHTDKIADFSWNTNDEHVMASVDDANVLQIWQMAANIYDDEEDEEGGKDKEKGGKNSASTVDMTT